MPVSKFSKRIRRQSELETSEAVKKLQDLQKAYPNDEIGKAANAILEDLGIGVLVDPRDAPDLGLIIFVVLEIYLLISQRKHKNVETFAAILSKRFPECQTEISKCLDDYHTSVRRLIPLSQVAQYVV